MVELTQYNDSVNWRITVKKMNIAIDGPASAGKSTIARQVAAKLGFIYLDTGAMYRSLTYGALKENISVDDEGALLHYLRNATISILAEGGQQRVYLNGEDVSDPIRETEVSNHVSAVSSHAKVRAEMVARQQQIAKNGGVVMDGRDIGTVVLPDAEVKIFLIASAEERALRRYREYQAKGIDTTLEELRKDMERRDYLDTHRSASPLRKADDAIEVDTTSLDIAQVVEKVLAYVGDLQKPCKN